MDNSSIFVIIGMFLLIPASIVIVLRWPTAALILFLVFLPVKMNLRLIMPYLHGWVGFLSDAYIAVMTLLSIIVLRARDKNIVGFIFEKKVMITWLLLLTLTCFGLFFTRDQASGIQKTVLLTIMGSLFVWIGILIASSSLVTQKFITAMIISGAALTILLLVFGSPSAEYEGARLSLGYGNILILTDIISYMIIALITYSLGRKTFVLRLTALIFIPLGLLSILLAGSRGALLALAFCTLYLMWLYRKQHDIKIVFVLLLLALGIYFIIDLFFTTRAESMRFSSEYLHEGLFSRLLMSGQSLKEWSQSPILGRGTGDISLQLTGVVGAQYYPHNLFLEILNELGLIGFAVFCYLFGLGARIFWPSRRLQSYFHPNHLNVIRCCFLLHIIFAFKTGSYAGGNLCYIFLGLALGQYGFARQHLTLEEHPQDISELESPDELLDLA